MELIADKKSTAHYNRTENYPSSLKQLIKAIPEECFQKKPLLAWSWLILDFLMFGAFLYLTYWVDNWVIGSFIGIFLTGFVLTGLFVIGHDAGHRAFSSSLRINNIVGHLTTSLMFWPFHLWRIAHNHHHKHTNHVDKDNAWEPHTAEELAKLPKFYAGLYKLIHKKIWLFWLASFLYNFVLLGSFLAKDPVYKKPYRKQIWFSILFAAVVVVIYASATIYIAGFYGFVTMFLLPQCTYYFWLTTFTFLHHTIPEQTFLPDEQWEPVKAQLEGTINVRYGKYVDFFTHHIAWHVPHHVTVGIPHYQLKKAHQAIKTAYPETVKERKFSFQYLKHSIEQCQEIKSREEPDWQKFTF